MCISGLTYLRVPNSIPPFLVFIISLHERGTSLTRLRIRRHFLCETHSTKHYYTTLPNTLENQPNYTHLLCRRTCSPNSRKNVTRDEFKMSSNWSGGAMTDTTQFVGGAVVGISPRYVEDSPRQTRITKRKNHRDGES